MNDKNVLTIMSEDGDVIEVENYVLLELEQDDEIIEVLALVDQNGDNSFFILAEDDTLEPLRDQQLIAELQNIDL